MKALYEMKCSELGEELNRCHAKIKLIEDELKYRNYIDRKMFGYNVGGKIAAFPTFSEAVAASVQQFNDPEAGYKVSVVYV